MGIIQYLRDSKQKKFDLEKLSKMHSKVINCNQDVEHSAIQLSRFLRINSDLINFLNNYYEMRHKHFKAFYENNIIFRQLYDDPETTSIYDNIDKLITEASQTPNTEYDYSPKQIEALENVYHKMQLLETLKISDATASSKLGHVLFPHINDKKIWDYYQNQIFVTRSKKDINIDQYAIIQNSLADAIDLINYLNYQNERLDDSYDEYLTHYNHCKEKYPEDVKKISKVEKYVQDIIPESDHDTISKAKNLESIDEEEKSNATKQYDILNAIRNVQKNNIQIK